MKAEVKRLFHELADVPEEARSQYLASHPVDEETRREVEALLAFDAGASAFLMRDIGIAAGNALPQLYPIGGMCGPYRLLKIVGQGGMGAVYLAERVDGEVTQRLAVKLLSPGAGDFQRERFLKERQILASLTHPNIAHMLDAGHIENGQPYLAMEYVEGKPIDVFAAGLNTRQKIALFLKVCAAVSYLHRNVIVHRDLKPSNILVTSEGEPKLLDFGIAKILDVATNSTVTSMRMLTPDYASPEQVTGATLGTATDIYSLGAVLYRLLTGKPPHQFADHSPEGIARAITSREALQPSKWLPELRGDLDSINLKALRKDPRERYPSVEEFAQDLQAFLLSRPVRARSSDVWYRARKLVRRFWMPTVGAAIVIGSLAVAGASYYSSRHIAGITEKDTLMLAEFSNRTGEPIFDGTLRQGLAAQLEQSPYLTLLSDNRIAETLALMALPKDTPLTGSIVFEVCQRADSAAAILGSVARLGNEYVVGLRAVNCHTGDTLDDEQATAAVKERVLLALDEAAARLRHNLGESLPSIRKYDAPAGGVTTPSLEALKAYTEGIKTRRLEGEVAALPSFRQALTLDPNFAMAYLQMGTSYLNVGEEAEANQNIEKAFALRGRVSARESFSIASDYLDWVTGDLLKADEIHLLWSRTYPQDTAPLDALGNDYIYRGLYSQALDALQAEERLAGQGFYNVTNLVIAYLGLNRGKEGRLAVQRAQARNMDPVNTHALLYLIDFLEANVSGMRADVAWAAGRPGVEHNFFDMESDTEAYWGHRQEAWSLSKQAVATAERDHANESAAHYFLSAALHEAEFGNAKRAIEAVDAALQLAPSRGIKTAAALALARASSVTRAQRMADELAKANPSHTLLGFYWLPAIRAAIELDSNHPAEAIELLRLAGPYELGQPYPLGPGTLYPAYLRGEAYLRLKDGRRAAEEFQKILEHPGCVLNFLTGALARLNLGRALVLAGDKRGARTAFDEFFQLWKNADADIPILAQAKAEYARL
jgi:eukaryotic-like serine/threonine-protein kinase